MTTTGPTLSRVLTSELVKLRGLRSSLGLLAAGLLFTVALGPVQSIGQVVDDDATPLPGTGAALSLVLTGVTSAVILFGVLGVLSATSEFTHRSIGITFTAVPRRGRVVAGKALALVATLLPVVLVGVVVAFEAGRRILAEDGFSLTWTDPGALRVVLAAAAYVVGWAVLGQALGWLLKSSVGASFALLGVMFVLPVLTLLLPGRAAEDVLRLLPSEVGAAMLRTDPGTGALYPGAAALVWGGYLALGLALAAWAAHHRDA